MTFRTAGMTELRWKRAVSEIRETRMCNVKNPIAAALSRSVSRENTCSRDGCSKEIYCKGKCFNHYHSDYQKRRRRMGKK